MRKRYIVHFKDHLFGEWCWAESKKEARQNMTPYARCIGSKITSIEEV